MKSGHNTQLTLDMASDSGPRAFDLPDAQLHYFPALFPAQSAAALFQSVYAQTQWAQHRVQIYGREWRCPRLSAWYGDAGAAYRYSGLSLTASGWTETVGRIKAEVEWATGHTFNSALLNLYRDGADSMGWHADNERELGIDPIIASVSLGAQRKFKLRQRHHKPRSTFDITLESGSLLLMSGATQHHWQHCLPRTSKIHEPRINLTFRCVNGAGMLST